MTKYIAIHRSDENLIQDGFTSLEDLREIGVLVERCFSERPKSQDYFNMILYRVAENGILFYEDIQFSKTEENSRESNLLKEIVLLKEAVRDLNEAVCKNGNHIVFLEAELERKQHGLQWAKKFNDHLFDVKLKPVNWGQTFCDWGLINTALIAVDKAVK